MEKNDKPPPVKNYLCHAAPDGICSCSSDGRIARRRKVDSLYRLSGPDLRFRLRDDVPLLALNGFNH